MLEVVKEAAEYGNPEPERRSAVPMRRVHPWPGFAHCSASSDRGNFTAKGWR